MEACWWGMACLITDPSSALLSSSPATTHGLWRRRGLRGGMGPRASEARDSLRGWREESGTGWASDGSPPLPDFPDGAPSNRQLFLEGTRPARPQDPRALLRQRRKLSREALLEALRAARFGAAYSTALADAMEGFVDRAVVRAVALKRMPEFVGTRFEFRARAYIQRTRVASSIRWLKHNGLTVPRIGKLTALVEDHVSVLHPRIKWLKSIHVKGRDLGIVLTQETSILEKSIEELESTAEFLENHGVKRDWVGLVVKRCPKVLSLGNIELHKRAAFFAELGITEHKFGIMVYNFPESLVQFSLEEMQNKVDYLRNFGLESHSLGQVIAAKPALFASNVEDDWGPIVRYLYFLGVEQSGMRRILIVHPSVFCLSLDAVVPKVQFLRAIGVHEEAISNVLVKFPAILTYSLDKKIRPVVMFLLETAGVSERDIGKVMAAHPEIIRCSLPNKLVVLVKYFLSHGFHRDELGRMLADFPMLIKYSLPVLQPKLKFFMRRMGRQLNEIVKFPRYFSYSLQSRIAPRHRILQEKELYFGLDYMLACSDAEFIDRVEAVSGSASERVPNTVEKV